MSDNENVHVRVCQGLLAGRRRNVSIHSSVSHDGAEVIEFLGVPYAEPPESELRFQKPRPPKPWQGIRNATKLASAAPQNLVRNLGDGDHPGEEIWNPKEPQSEDCLYLNIWTPLETFVMRNIHLPVMVWIHGGSYQYGSGGLSLYNGSVLSFLGNVVVVSINYRLGPLGFFFHPTERQLKHSIVTNQGLWDQQQALRWIGENIDRFGGDRRNVCLFGESAGAASISLHLLSPSSHGLFHKVILQSGTVFSPWALCTPSDLQARSHQLIQKVSSIQNHLVHNGNIGEDIPLDDIVHRACEIPSDDSHLGICWAPCVDGDFLPDQPEILFQNEMCEPCSIMMGTTKDEGSYFLLYVDNLEEFTHKTDLLQWPSPLTQERMKQILVQLHCLSKRDNESANRILEFYTQQLTSQHFEGIQLQQDIILQSMADHYFIADVHRFIHHWTKSASDKKSLYLYRFSYRSMSVHPWPEWCGVMHGDEIQYVFGQPLQTGDDDIQLQWTDKDRDTSLAMINLWTSFARTGCPQHEQLSGVSVHSSQDREIPYFDITNEGILLKQDPYRKEFADFWNSQDYK